MYRYPLSKAIWMPTLIWTTSSFWYSLFKILCNHTVAILCDVYYILTFKKPKAFVKVRYLEKLFDMFGIFTNTSWKFTNGNVKDLLLMKIEKCSLSTSDWSNGIHIVTIFQKE
jgi:hypothetical protein